MGLGGHEGKYTQSTSVPNLAHRFVGPNQLISQMPAAAITDTTTMVPTRRNIPPPIMEINRNTLPNQYMARGDNEFVMRRPSSQSEATINRGNVPPPSPSSNNSHGNYVDIDALDRLQTKMFQQYSNFDRNYSFNQNHQQNSLEAQHQNLIGLRNYNNSGTPGHDTFISPSISAGTSTQQQQQQTPSPQTSQLQINHYKLGAPTISTTTIASGSSSTYGSGNHDGSPIYENHPQVGVAAPPPPRSESPIYSNTTTSNLSNYHHPEIGGNKQLGAGSIKSVYQINK